MKIATKIFLIIGIISYAICSLFLIGILPLIFNIIALVKLNKATCKKDVAPVWAILTILLGWNFFPGLFMFFLKDEDFAA